MYTLGNYIYFVVVKPKSKCQGNERITLSGSGNVSSYVSRTTQCGSTDSPLIIQGMHIKEYDIEPIDDLKSEMAHIFEENTDWRCFNLSLNN